MTNSVLEWIMGVVSGLPGRHVSRELEHIFLTCRKTTEEYVGGGGCQLELDATITKARCYNKCPDVKVRRHEEIVTVEYIFMKCFSV